MPPPSTTSTATLIYVLSDAQKRQIYDLYGEEGRKSGNFSNALSPSYNEKEKSFRYNPRDTEAMFAEFLRSGSESWDRKKSAGGSGAGGNRRETGKKAAMLERQLACSLEELYKGSKRKMKISRIVSDDFGFFDRSYLDYASSSDSGGGLSS